METLLRKMKPKVSFIVPCYKLGHLLSDCVESILCQTYRDFEVLIMDDCSPDDTPEVARSFQDPRVTHIRNEPNLGHLPNYNKGIGLSRGKYIWLISADDQLRTPYVLQRYVELMDRHPEVGFVFCPGVGILDGKEIGLLGYSVHDSQDAIFEGHRFLLKLLERNTVLAAAGMVRRECYERVGVFPLDMPYGGDWFLWCAFALHYDVGYFAEPMVNYRQHDLSMTNLLRSEDERILMKDDITLPWRIKKECEKAGYNALASSCVEFIVRQYLRCFLGREWRNPATRLTPQEFDSSVESYTSNLRERNYIRARVFSTVGDRCYGAADYERALFYYRQTMSEGFFMPALWLKYGLLRMGPVGKYIRDGLSDVSSWRKGLPGKAGTNRPGGYGHSS